MRGEDVHFAFHIIWSIKHKTTTISAQCYTNATHGRKEIIPQGHLLTHIFEDQSISFAGCILEDVQTSKLVQSYTLASIQSHMTLAHVHVFFSCLCEIDKLVDYSTPRLTPAEMCFGQTNSGRIIGHPRMMVGCPFLIASLSPSIPPSDVPSTLATLPVLAPPSASPFQWATHVRLTTQLSSDLSMSQIEFRELCWAIGYVRNRVFSFYDDRLYSQRDMLYKRYNIHSSLLYCDMILLQFELYLQ